MTTNQLQNIVFLETAALICITLMIGAAFKRWKITMWISGASAAIATFTAWSFVMALGSIMVYGTAITLLWFEHETKIPTQFDRKTRYMRAACWTCLATGVCMLIAKNVYNIYTYLH